MTDISKQDEKPVTAATKEVSSLVSLSATSVKAEAENTRAVTPKMVTKPIAVNCEVKKMSNKKSETKSKAKPENKTKDKSELKEKKQAEKIAKAEKKAKEKAASKAREIEKKAKKASEKARQMARKALKREKEETKIKYERRMKREEAVVYFTSLITGLEKGTVQFKQGKDTVVITPSDLVDVEIKAQTKGKMEKVTFEISWLTTYAKDISITSA